MADQYKFTPETYIFDLMKLSDSHYSRGMLILDLLFLKHLLKPFQAAIAMLMAYVIINSSLLLLIPPTLLVVPEFSSANKPSHFSFQ